MATTPAQRALSAHDIRTLLALLVHDSQDAGLVLTAKAVELTLAVVDFEITGSSQDNEPKKVSVP